MALCIPPPEQLRAAPELASLRVLSEALDAATGALQAAFPELCCDDDDFSRPLADPDLLAAAERILWCAEDLSASVSCYWSATMPREPEPSPFERGSKQPASDPPS